MGFFDPFAAGAIQATGGGAYSVGLGGGGLLMTGTSTEGAHIHLSGWHGEQTGYEGSVIPLGTGGEGIVASEMFVVDEEGYIAVQSVITVTGTQIIVGPNLNFSFTAMGGDTFTGGAYSDEMIAGPGKSTFYGGAAADRITFNTLLQNAEDTFADFVPEVDIIEFSKSSFTGFSGIKALFIN